jgi:ribosome-associated toxin RatA of RatAB toxin-antitoxin module
MTILRASRYGGQASAQTTMAAGGHTRARRLACVAAWAIAAATAFAGDGVDVSVQEEKGTYHVAAAFEVQQSHATAHAVLTDYEQVPRFMPDVRTSIVRERTPERILLEQEAVAKLMFFSKRVQLLLEVQETTDTITFKDTSGKSFARYEGRWMLTAREDRTEIRYALTARPTFSVPKFILTKLLKRDAGRMIEGIRAEIAKR